MAMVERVERASGSFATYLRIIRIVLRASCTLLSVTGRLLEIVEAVDTDAMLETGTSDAATVVRLVAAALAASAWALLISAQSWSFNTDSHGRNQPIVTVREFPAGDGVG
jgi:hypothetical protein